ncbi:penicillin-binding protein 2 [Candidatus Tisiphia endosymbiont of Beris chalybata]|uniref:penicillin-binding protein 2 n=1 Tax=Candidatus Tisiphia endosymbiont of Beris chalybata TaxID=3066262 RepID=UPI00312C7D61
MLSKKILYNQLISRRSFLIGAGKMSLLSLLASKMIYMQLFESVKYRTLSDKNRINFVLLSPVRGQIYDVNGTVLAINQACFRLLLDRNINANYQNELKLIFNILNFSEEKIGAIKNKIKKANTHIPFAILDNLTWQQMALIEEQKPYLNSLFIDAGLARFYPFSDSACHIIGYIGQINEQEKQDLKINNLGDFYVGKFGLEKYYEEKLRGEFGYKQVEVNAVGKHVREIASFHSNDGQDLYLNIDIDLQHKIQPYLSKQGCSAIVMDVKNGNILILAMSPVFETNNFIKLSNDYWQTLINDPYKPLINKIVQSTYPPGSVFKIITILTALEHGLTPDHSFHCSGASVLGSNSFRCWKTYGHGRVDMYNAMKYSCNTYMYEVGRLVGFRKILNMAKKFGFGKKTGVDLTGEVSGFLPSEEWKVRKLKSPWSLGDTLNLSIGQGFLLSTPIQLASFATAIASDGKLYKPRIAKEQALFEQIDIQQKHLDVLKEGMFKAVNTEGGTGYYSRILGEKKQLAGKTGTAQVQSKASIDDDLSRENIAWERRNHAIFMGFAPYHQPRYSILVYLDHGGGGGKAAAPIASKIMSMVLDKYA